MCGVCKASCTCWAALWHVYRKWVQGQAASDCVKPWAQEDVFIPTLSVWETLAISTRLRLPGRLPAADRDALMDDSLRSMGLHRKKYSQVRT